MVKILREADRRPVAEVAKKHAVSEQTVYAWRKRFGALAAVDVKRLRQLEQKNGRLKARESRAAPAKAGNTRRGHLRTFTYRPFGPPKGFA